MLSHRSFLTSRVENNHPAFLLIPFRPDDIFNNAKLNKGPKLDLHKQLKARYPGKHVTITNSGREALALAVKQAAKPSDSVLIQTTSDNHYISSCVTKCIERSNPWHRDSTKNASCLLINHEFGYVDNRVLEKASDDPCWIEDCAFSLNSKYSNGQLCGSLAPYSVFSFSKFFPIQIGGFLLSKHPIVYNADDETVSYISNVVGHYFAAIEEWSTVRLELHNYYSEVFQDLGCSPYFDQTRNDVPGVFLFRVPDHVDVDALKLFYWQRGVQCSVFYGTRAFFLPLNQFTTRNHVDYFADLFISFNSGKK